MDLFHFDSDGSAVNLNTVSSRVFLIRFPNLFFGRRLVGEPDHTLIHIENSLNIAQPIPIAIIIIIIVTIMAVQSKCNNFGGFSGGIALQ